MSTLGNDVSPLRHPWLDHGVHPTTDLLTFQMDDRLRRCCGQLPGLTKVPSYYLTPGNDGGGGPPKETTNQRAEAHIHQLGYWVKQHAKITWVATVNDNQRAEAHIHQLGYWLKQRTEGY